MNTTAQRVSFNPRKISGLNMWLRADKGIILNGSNVSQWQDQSGSSNHVTQSNASNQPGFFENVLNGRPIVKFTAPNHFMSITAPLTGSTQSIFAVFRNFSSSPVVSSMILCTTAINGDRYFGVNVQVDGTCFAHFDPSVVTSPATAGTKYNVLSAIQNGANARAYINGLGGTASSSFSISDTRTLDSLGQYTTPGLRINGELAEIVYYNVVLSETDRQSVENYLNLKYRIY
jgi:hypothetical protein